MLAIKPVGRNASAMKYDLITAVGAYGLSMDKTVQKRMLRFLTLITARYNWQRNELTVGQREIARLWNVDERTVKREMAKLRTSGWLVVQRQGVRGRVTEYGLDLEQILMDTQPQWSAVGPDFEHRLSGSSAPDPKVVPLQTQGMAQAPDTADGREWSLAKALLHREDISTYSAWIAPIERVDRAGGRLQLRAPSRFHATYVMSHLKQRILAACRDVDDEIEDIAVSG